MQIKSIEDITKLDLFFNKLELLNEELKNLSKNLSRNNNY
jgi:hypothetical protein